ncbi:MAG TPA: MEDS domain-containing protein [Gemmatimonadaceae bacterium]|nr:MEDS domain-containing protein [Gemmatimonadaceae bacterium]
MSKRSVVSRPHSIVIHKDDDSLASIAAQMLVSGIQYGQPALLITAGGHLDAVRDKLSTERIDPDDLIAAGWLTVVDAETLLNVLMVGDVPDPIRFRHMAGSLLEQLCATREVCIPVIYSDMAGRLWRRGNKAAALSLEILWNGLATAYNFSLICGYYGDPSVTSAPTLEELEAICQQHNEIIEMRPN